MIHGEITHEIIGAAIQVHRVPEPGEDEAVYEEALCLALGFCRSVSVPLSFQNKRLHKSGCFDLLVEGFPVHVLAMDKALDIHRTHLAALLRHADMATGWILNFNGVLLKDGIHRCFASPRPPSSAVHS